MVNHTAEYLVIACIDFRLQKYLYAWLSNNNMLGISDLLTVPGASKELIKPSSNCSSATLLSQIETSINFHNTKKVILIEHQNCGMYAVDNTVEQHTDLETEMKIHKEISESAKKIIEDRFTVKVQNLFMTLNGDVNEYK